MLVELNSDEEGMCGATSYQAEEIIIEEIIETEMEVTRYEPVVHQPNHLQDSNLFL